jgi:hypothetical protein
MAQIYIADHDSRTYEGRLSGDTATYLGIIDAFEFLFAQLLKYCYSVHAVDDSVLAVPPVHDADH